MKIKVRVFLITFALLGGLVFALHFFGTEGNLALDIKLPEKAAVSDAANQTNPAQPLGPNLTNVVAKKIAADFFLQNPSGPVPDSNGGFNVGLTSGNVSQHLLDAMQKIQDDNAATLAGTDILDIDVSELHISADASRDAEKKYVLAVQNILRSRLQDAQSQTILQIFLNAYQNNDMTKVDDLIRRHDLAIQDLKNADVPVSWLNEHKELISLLLESKLLLTNLRTYQQDPMRALIAIQAFQDFEKKAFDLQNKVAGRIKNENLL